MYKNIVFDLGGVLVDFDPRRFLLDRFCNADIERRVYNITFGSLEWQDLDAGKLTRRQGDAIMMKRARELHCAFEVQCVLDDWIASLNTRQSTAGILRRLKELDFHVYYLSNIPEDALKFLRRKEFFSLFEGGVPSCEVHINKPDPAIYQTFLERYGLDPAETIFIDDRLENAQAADALGIHGIHYQGAGQLIEALNGCGIVLEKPAELEEPAERESTEEEDDED